MPRARLRATARLLRPVPQADGSVPIPTIAVRTGAPWTAVGPPAMLATMSTDTSGLGPCELRVGPQILRLHGRTLEIFSADSDHTVRRHVDTVAVEAREGTDRKGRIRVHIGLKSGDGLHLGAERTKLDLDPEQWLRFQQFVAVLKRVQAAGPEPW